MSHTTSDHPHWRYTVGRYVSPFYWPDEHSAVWHGFDHYRDPTPADVVTVHRPDGSTYDLTRADWHPDAGAAVASLAVSLDTLAAVLTVDHLRPALIDLGVPDPDRYVVAIEYDRSGQAR